MVDWKEIIAIICVVGVVVGIIVYRWLYMRKLVKEYKVYIKKNDNERTI